MKKLASPNGVTLKHCLFPAIILLIILSGCSSSRDVVKSRADTTEERVKELSDSLKVVKIERDVFRQQVEELNHLSGTFDNTPCPEIKPPNCPDMLNKDSVDLYISRLNDALNKSNNKVKIYADGSMELTGRIRSFDYLNKKLHEQIVEKDRIIDSLKSSKQKEVVITKTVTEYKEVHSKVKFMNFWWLLALGLIIGFVGGVYLCYRIRKKHNASQAYSSNLNTMQTTNRKKNFPSWIIYAAVAMLALQLAKGLGVQADKKFDLVYSSETIRPGYETDPAGIRVYGSPSVRWEKAPKAAKVIGTILWLLIIPGSWYAGTYQKDKKVSVYSDKKNGWKNYVAFWGPIFGCVIAWFAAYSAKNDLGSYVGRFDDFIKEFKISDEMAAKIQSRQVTYIKDENGLLTEYFRGK